MIEKTVFARDLAPGDLFLSEGVWTVVKARGYRPDDDKRRVRIVTADGVTISFLTGEIIKVRVPEDVVS